MADLARGLLFRCAVKRRGVAKDRASATPGLLPALKRITLYGSAKFLAKKAGEGWREIAAAGIARIHSGLESVDPETLGEVRTLVENLAGPTRLRSDHASNFVDVRGGLPADRAAMLRLLEGPASWPYSAFRPPTEQLIGMTLKVGRRWPGGVGAPRAGEGNRFGVGGWVFRGKYGATPSPRGPA